MITSTLSTLVRSRFKTLAFMAAAIGIAASAPVGAQDNSPVDRAVQLARKGNVEAAIDQLRVHLKKNASDGKARVVLGQILDFDGRPDEAVAVWEQGVTGAESDFDLLMLIGDIRERQGQDGPAITRRRGMVGAQPKKDEAAEKVFKESHLVQAAAAFERARKLKPDDLDAAMALASIFALQKKHDAAAQIWKSLIEREPKNAGYYLRFASAIQEAGRPDEAAAYLEKAIALNPRLAEAHQALGEYQKAKGRVAEAKQSENRAEFYRQLPSFCTLVYSDENQKALENLQEPDALRKLVGDTSDRATQFLAVLCWSHPHNELETEAFNALESRGAATTTILSELLKQARSTCTVRSTARILARRKAEGVFDHLVRILPGDIRGLGMDMDIAGSLDDLGDPRAVGPLVQVLDPGNANKGQDQLMTDRDGARGRAALALGAFDTPEARRALEQGTHTPEVMVYCLAALCRVSRDQKQLSALEKAVESDRGAPTSRLGYYLKAKVGTPEAKKLAAAWEQKRKAEEAAEKAKTQDSPAAKAKRE
jgi:tetratricopeptide (TPR) repeat protein